MTGMPNPQEMELFAAHGRQWNNRAVAWGPAADKDPAKYVNALYRAAGYPPPTKIVVCASPMSRLILQIACLRYNLDLRNRRELEKFLMDHLFKRGTTAWTELGPLVLSDVKKNIAILGTIPPGEVLAQNMLGRLKRRTDKDRDFGHLGSAVRWLPIATVPLFLIPTLSWNPHLGQGLARRRLAKILSKEYSFVYEVKRYIPPLMSRFARRQDIESYSLDERLWYKGCREDYPILALYRAYEEIVPFRNMCLLTALPVEYHIENNALHNLDGPALVYRDHWKTYFISGVVMPAQIWEQPNWLTLKVINRTKNSEIRIRMIRKYGNANYVRDSRFVVVEDAATVPALRKFVGLRDARLLATSASMGPLAERYDPIYALELTNSTPEPDGSFKKYYLAVNPNMYDGRSGREILAAAASLVRDFRDPTRLFYKRPEDYNLSIET
jgi:hypothetical protein